MTMKLVLEADTMGGMIEALKLWSDALAPQPAATGAPISVEIAKQMNPQATPLEQAIEEAKTTAVEPNVQPAKEKKGRGRPKKAETAPAIGGHTVENAGGDENFPIIKTLIKEQAAAPTKDDARAALKALTGAKNMQAGIDLLKTFGAENLSTLDPAKYGEFIAACNAGAAS